MEPASSIRYKSKLEAGGLQTTLITTVFLGRGFALLARVTHVVSILGGKRSEREMAYGEEQTSDLNFRVSVWVWVKGLG